MKSFTEFDEMIGYSNEKLVNLVKTIEHILGKDFVVAGGIQTLIYGPLASIQVYTKEPGITITNWYESSFIVSLDCKLPSEKRPVTEYIWEPDPKRKPTVKYQRAKGQTFDQANDKLIAWFKRQK